VQWRLKGSSRGGFSAKCFVICSQANPVKEWVPEESISSPRYILFNRERPGRMLSVQNATEAVRMYGFRRRSFREIDEPLSSDHAAPCRRLLWN
jgi:hypothetical protein